MIKKENIEEIVKQEFPDVAYEQLSKDFIDYLFEHITLVNQFASKIGKEYPEHDSSKYCILFPVYRYSIKKDKTADEDELLGQATFIHVTQASHHPEYWCDKKQLEGFTRTNFTPNGPIDVKDMPEEALDEMVCDWCAMGVTHGNTGLEWFERVNGTRWIFSPEQQMYIRLRLGQLENGL